MRCINSNKLSSTVLHAEVITTSEVFFFFFLYTDSSHSELPVRLYNNETAGQGVVQVKYKGQWNFVNGSNWCFRSAAVTCKQLGMS